ncbi:hypothetical protein CRP01_41650 [Flavilitoribacter nigricans DSM 23189 = NBRC 102662]|uniref:Uncharacterized protein n=2 Tax=Flavilitoribacter TaxID=2762562 RepID=A0A2D0MWB0_FLAN2|nr:hypothetical protein CRP01_41650 [Flavilitoribacter nigricans DSM 23189 = NBRC 102662]
MKSEQRSEEIFKGKTIYLGVDVHRKSYQVSSLHEGQVLGKSVRIDGHAGALLKWARNRYKGAELIFGYEAGFSGLSLSRHLREAGYECHVLNPADIPSTNKDRVYKTDKRDSKKIAYALMNPYSNYNYQIAPWAEQLRQNVRGALRLNSDISRLQHRIKQNLYYLGLNMPRTARGWESWSQASREQIRQQAQTGGHLAIHLWLDQLEQLLGCKQKMWQDIDQMLLESPLQCPYELLQTLKGVGKILSATLVTEIIDMRRFSSINKLRSYIGLTPGETSSGEQVRVGSMTKRGNRILRWALIQVARRVMDSDAEIAMRYAQWRKQCSHDHKAIVKVANLLLGRIRSMWLKQEAYRSPYSDLSAGRLPSEASSETR